MQVNFMLFLSQYHQYALSYGFYGLNLATYVIISVFAMLLF